jgi:hypothetical protein
MLVWGALVVMSGVAEGRAVGGTSTNAGAGVLGVDVIGGEAASGGSALVVCSPGWTAVAPFGASWLANNFLSLTMSSVAMA